MTTAAVMRGCAVLLLPHADDTDRRYRIVERQQRRFDPVNPIADERSPLLGLSPGILDNGDPRARGTLYGGVLSESPRP
jgi:hypothetical protein